MHVNFLPKKKYTKTFILLIVFVCLLNNCFQKNTLSIVSFNIRYENNKDSINNWKNRKALVASFLKEGKSDIICLQEVLYSQLVYLQIALPNYNSVGVGRLDGENRGEFTPIFFNTQTISLIEKGHFWLSETPDKVGSIGWDANTARIATWALFKDTKNGDMMYVINTHLDNKGKKSKKGSAKLIINWIKQTTLGYPVILAGDFNMTEESDAYHAIVNNNTMIDSYKTTPIKKGVNYSYHNFGNKAIEKRTKIDYIFVSNNIHVISTIIQREASQKQFMLSDHNPMTVEFQLKKNR